jgi:hypothetical protein
MNVMLLIFIITNVELRFEQCVPQLDLELMRKRPQKREDHLIFISFRVKKFTERNTQPKTKKNKKKNFNV